METLEPLTTGTTPSCEVEEVLRSRIIWEKPFEQELCIGSGRLKKCVTVGGAVRLLQTDADFLVELELLGAQVKYKLFDSCYPVYSKGIATLKVCTTNVVISGRDLKSIDMSIRLCIGKWGIEQCWDIYKDRIVFSRIRLADLLGDLAKDVGDVGEETITVGA